MLTAHGDTTLFQVPEGFLKFLIYFFLVYPWVVFAQAELIVFRMAVRKLFFSVKGNWHCLKNPLRDS